jgi:hypothetical protein
MVLKCCGSASQYCYCIELATEEKALLALDPIRRIVPTTRTRITASITAYSAMSCPVSSDQILRMNSDILSSNPAHIPCEGEELHSMQTMMPQPAMLVKYQVRRISHKKSGRLE